MLAVCATYSAWGEDRAVNPEAAAGSLAFGTDGSAAATTTASRGYVTVAAAGSVAVVAVAVAA